MNREDLGKMLERNLRWPISGNMTGADESYLIEHENAVHDAAEGFWNDVIDTLVAKASDDYVDDGEGYNAAWVVAGWIETQKIKED